MSEWKYTIPVMRAEDRADGLYLVGEASGPEVDTHRTEMSPECIADFRDQIVTRAASGDPLPYRDNHLKGPNVGVLGDLGWVIDGEVSPNNHLRVTVKLDEENPAAVYTHKQVQRGKRYGMSIKGDGTEYELVRRDVGPVVRFNRVMLSEISHVTAPSWVPSFGTVLARSVDGELGVQQMTDTLEAAPAPVETTDAAESPSTEAAPVERADETETISPETQAETPAADEVPVERARIAKKDADALTAAFLAMGQQIVALGIELPKFDPAPSQTEAPSAPADSAPAPTAVENAAETGNDTTAATDLVDLGGVQVERSLAEAVTNYVTAQVAELKQTVERQAEYIIQLENLPPGRLPAPVVREKFEALPSEVERMTPQEKLSWALGRIYDGVPTV